MDLREMIKVSKDEGAFFLKDSVILEISWGDLELANYKIAQWMKEHPEYQFSEEYDIPNRGTLIRWRRKYNVDRTEESGADSPSLRA